MGSLLNLLELLDLLLLIFALNMSFNGLFSASISVCLRSDSAFFAFFFFSILYLLIRLIVAYSDGGCEFTLTAPTESLLVKFLLFSRSKKLDYISRVCALSRSFILDRLLDLDFSEFFISSYCVKVFPELLAKL